MLCSRDDFCYTFIINIKEDETVSPLRNAIKEKKRPEFDDIPASSLSVWKASVPVNRNLENCVEALNLVDDDALFSYEILSDIFSSDLKSKSVHIIIDRPHSGELQLPSLYSIILTFLHIRSPFGDTLC